MKQTWSVAPGTRDVGAAPPPPSPSRGPRQLGTGRVKGKTKPEQVLQPVPKTAEENRTSRRGLWAGRSQLAGTASPLAQDRASEQLQDDERPGGRELSTRPASNQPQVPTTLQGHPGHPGAKMALRNGAGMPGEIPLLSRPPLQPGHAFPLSVPVLDFPCLSLCTPHRAQPRVLTGLSAPCAPPGLC